MFFCRKKIDKKEFQRMLKELKKNGHELVLVNGVSGNKKENNIIDFRGQKVNAGSFKGLCQCLLRNMSGQNESERKWIKIDRCFDDDQSVYDMVKNHHNVMVESIRRTTKSPH